MDSECRQCVFFYYEDDTNYKKCKHPEYDEETDNCPGYYNIEDAKADAKYKDCDRY